MVDWKQALVTESKILGYLLAPDHPIGGSKAEFFHSLGYTRSEWTKLRDDLAALPRHGDVKSEETNRFGKKYVVDGVLHTPSERVVALRTVWIIHRDGQPPRLVTAYPR